MREKKKKYASVTQLEENAALTRGDAGSTPVWRTTGRLPESPNLPELRGSKSNVTATLSYLKI